MVVATSRARLSVGGEHCFPVEGMNYPDKRDVEGLAINVSERIAPYSALRLFADGAQRARPGFALTAEALADVVHICRLVEGMPLGILLAAAWVEMLSPAEISAEIERGLDFLETDARDVPVRQRSMRAVFEHSWGLLNEREREILSKLSVFRGGFAREAAERIVSASLRELMALDQKSLLHRSLDGRYEVHELVRQCAAGKLAASPDVERWVRDRHSAFYTTALEKWSQALKGARQLAALAEIEADLGNARAAWAWAVDQRDVSRLDRAIDGLCRFYEWRGRYEEGEAACRAAAEVLSAPDGKAEKAVTNGRSRVWARATAWRGAFCRDARRLERSQRLLEDSLACLEALDAAGHDVRRERAFALW
jgi:predicted ATPase